MILIFVFRISIIVKKLPLSISYFFLSFGFNRNNIGLTIAFELKTPGGSSPCEP